VTGACALSAVSVVTTWLVAGGVDLGDWSAWLKIVGPLTSGPDPVTNTPSNFQFSSNFKIQNGSLPTLKKDANFAWGLDLNIMNNFLNWIDLKSST
jgi:hypothetical protein